MLSLVAEAAADSPLVCLIDDAQWLDTGSAQVLGFVARRLMAESVALVFALRDTDPHPALVGLPRMVVEGLAPDDARALLDAAVPGPLDRRVRDRIVAETRGNPLALLELPLGLTHAELAGGFGLSSAAGLSGRIEDSFRRRLVQLSPDQRRLVLLAAADPLGDPGLLWRAAARLEISVGDTDRDAIAGLLQWDELVTFRHPLVRSATYRSASSEQRWEAHRALAEATDPVADADRRAWHLALATAGPDEAVADELDRSADRALARGGFAASAAFLERAAALTPDPREAGGPFAGGGRGAASCRRPGGGAPAVGHHAGRATRRAPAGSRRPPARRDRLRPEPGGRCPTVAPARGPAARAARPGAGP